MHRKVVKYPLTATFLMFVALLVVTVKWLAAKTASEMTYTVSGGALNST